MHTYLISLPQMTLTYQDREKPFADTSNPPCLFVTGGNPPSPSWLKKVSEGKDIWVADHGIDICCKTDLLPKCLIGDLDSLSSDSLLWAKKHQVPIHRYPTEKDDTDTQLALQMISADGYTPIIMTGAFGNRFDHMFSSIMTAASATVPIVISDERESIFFLKEGQNLTIDFPDAPKAISLMPLFGDADGVTLAGTHWELEDTTLYERQQTAVSNRLEEGSHRMESFLEKGTLAVYICMSE